MPERRGLWGLFWRWDGRINRITLLFGQIIVTGAAIIAAFVGASLFGLAKGQLFSPNAVSWLAPLVLIVAYIFSAALFAQRLHDLGWSAVWLIGVGAVILGAHIVALGFFPSVLFAPWGRFEIIKPLIGFPLTLFLGGCFVWRGQAKENRFGPPPPPGIGP